MTSLIRTDPPEHCRNRRNLSTINRRRAGVEASRVMTYTDPRPKHSKIPKFPFHIPTEMKCFYTSRPAAHPKMKKDLHKKHPRQPDGSRSPAPAAVRTDGGTNSTTDRTHMSGLQNHSSVLFRPGSLGNLRTRESIDETISCGIGAHKRATHFSGTLRIGATIVDKKSRPSSRSLPANFACPAEKIDRKKSGESATRIHAKRYDAQGSPCVLPRRKPASSYY